MLVLLLNLAITVPVPFTSYTDDCTVFPVYYYYNDQLLHVMITLFVVLSAIIFLQGLGNLL